MPSSIAFGQCIRDAAARPGSWRFLYASFMAIASRLGSQCHECRAPRRYGFSVMTCTASALGRGRCASQTSGADAVQVMTETRTPGARHSCIGFKTADAIAMSLA